MIHTDGKPTISSRTDSFDPDKKRLSRLKNVPTESAVAKLQHKLFNGEK